MSPGFTPLPDRVSQTWIVTFEDLVYNIPITNLISKRKINSQKKKKKEREPELALIIKEIKFTVIKKKKENSRPR